MTSVAIRRACKHLKVLAQFADKNAEDRGDVHGAIDELAMFIDKVCRENGQPAQYFKESL